MNAIGRFFIKEQGAWYKMAPCGIKYYFPIYNLKRETRIVQKPQPTEDRAKMVANRPG